MMTEDQISRLTALVEQRQDLELQIIFDATDALMKQLRINQYQTAKVVYEAGGYEALAEWKQANEAKL